MKKIIRAGKAPLIIKKRQPEFCRSESTQASRNPMARRKVSILAIKLISPRLKSPTARNPTFAAAPISPAINARDFPGQSSFTRATPSDHSPPIPSEATNRSAAMCQASVANPHKPVKTA